MMGHLVLGRYRVIDALAQGGMGMVYLSHAIVVRNADAYNFTNNFICENGNGVAYPIDGAPEEFLQWRKRSRLLASRDVAGSYAMLAYRTGDGGRAAVGYAAPAVVRNGKQRPARPRIELRQAAASPEEMAPCGEDISRWLSEGKLKPQIHQVYALEDAPKALQAMKNREVLGKMVIRL